jgi:hypothetical protein
MAFMGFKGICSLFSTTFTKFGFRLLKLRISNLFGQLVAGADFCKKNTAEAGGRC